MPQRGHELAATVRRLLLASGLGGAILLVVSDFATLYTVSAIGVTRLTVSGHDQHHYALAAVGVMAVVMLLGAATDAQPPLIALAVLGIVALVIGPISDAGVVGSAGVIGEVYDSATAHAGAGYHLELVGAVLLLISSAGLLLLSVPARSPRFRLGGPRSRPGGPGYGPGAPRSRPGAETGPAAPTPPPTPAARPAPPPASPATPPPAPRQRPTPPPASPATPGPAPSPRQAPTPRPRAKGKGRGDVLRRWAAWRSGRRS